MNKLKHVKDTNYELSDDSSELEEFMTQRAFKKHEYDPKAKQTRYQD